MVKAENYSNNEKHMVAVYGTLKRGRGNHRLLENSNVKYIGEYLTKKKYPMIQRGSIPFVGHGFEFLGLDKEVGHNIVVEVYEVDSKTLERLDALEGHPNWYYRDVVELQGYDYHNKAVGMYFNWDVEKMSESEAVQSELIAEF